jgi:hypothetical protein
MRLALLSLPSLKNEVIGKNAPQPKSAILLRTAEVDVVKLAL